MNKRQFADWIYELCCGICGNDKRFVVTKSYYEPLTESPRYDVLVTRLAGSNEITVSLFIAVAAQMGWSYKYNENNPTKKWVFDGKEHEKTEYWLRMYDNNHHFFRGDLDSVKREISNFLTDRISLFA